MATEQEGDSKDLEFHIEDMLALRHMAFALSARAAIPARPTAEIDQRRPSESTILYPQYSLPCNLKYFGKIMMGCNPNPQHGRYAHYTYSVSYQILHD